MTSSTDPTVIRIKLGGLHDCGEYTISAPATPLYTWTSGNCPIKLCGEGMDGDHADATKMALDPSEYLQGIWKALLESGHFLYAQFEHNGVIRLWSGGSTSREQVKEVLTHAAPRHLPAGVSVELGVRG
jgi:hypothetical protein